MIRANRPTHISPFRVGHVICDTSDMAHHGRSHLTVRQAAETVRVSRDLVYSAIAAGKLPHVVIKGVIHLDARDFEVWCERRRSARAEI